MEIKTCWNFYEHFSSNKNRKKGKYPGAGKVGSFICVFGFQAPMLDDDLITIYNNRVTSN